ncbi:Regulatory protein AfsR [Madurella mycetomatis]|uniref:Regulatory protein AfsR n=1 Tax=Madurella mycetomatis TaxID=100816 RepID=A0A175VZB5_9PEZI|nr:Regulatory protein AfsR [Madurella mycetomatis]KXX78986.1 Regulatory protein AfsR [Madurella mycetomatis]
MTVQRPTSRDDFDIAIVCALPLEFDAVVSILDEVWDDGEDHPTLGKAPGDLNTYLNGRIGRHNVVIVLLPQRMGKVNAAIVASDLRHSYRVRLALLVGICAGVPKAGDKEMLLGDVAISNSLYPDGFVRKAGAQDNLAGLNKEISGIINMIQNTEYKKRILHQKTASILKDLRQREYKYRLPNPVSDKLFLPGYRHKHQGSPTCPCQYHVEESDPVCEKAIEKPCEELGCEDNFLIARARYKERLAAAASPDDVSVPMFDPLIHIGRVASGDTVMKSAVTRDIIAETEQVIAFEMEGAGIWEHLPALVVKGVCDYADSHKNKSWQHYAAGSAASAAKALLSLVTPADKKLADKRLVDKGPVAGAVPRKFEWLVPFPPDPDFVDQPEISKWLREKSQVPGTRVALVGLSGIGKSQLALHFSHEVRNKSHVFWVNATTGATLEKSYRTIAERLGLVQSINSAEDTFSRIGRWLANEENGRWTVVLDNFDDTSVILNEDPRLLNTLPQTSNGFTVITSRTLQGAELLTGNVKNIYSVESMREELAVELFRTKLKDECQPDEAVEVVRLLGHMPLAISHAAAYINRQAPRVSAREYARMFRESDDRRKILLGSEYRDLRRDTPGSILSTWTVTFGQIQHERPSAVDLLSLMSFFSPQSIPEWALKPWYKPNPDNFPRVAIGDTLSAKEYVASSVYCFSRRSLTRPVKSPDAWSHLLRPSSADGGKDTTKPSKPSRLSFFKRKSAKPCSEAGDNTTNGSNSTRSSAGPEREFEEDLDILREYCLVTPTETQGVLKMHPLVRYCTQEWLAQSQSSDLYKKRFLLIMAQNIGSPNAGCHGCKAMGRTMLLHRRWAFSGSSKTWLLEKMIAVADRLIGPADYLTLECMDLLALNVEAEDPDKAWSLWEDLFGRAGRSNDGDITAARLSYAVALHRHFQHDKAERVARDVVKQRERALTRLAMELLSFDWSACNSYYQSRLIQHSTAIAKEMVGHRGPPDEVERMLRDMVEYAETVPLKWCVWSHDVPWGPFHDALSVVQEKQGKLTESIRTLDRGLECMAKTVFIPTSEPPTLLESLLDSQSGTEERQQLLCQVIEKLRSKYGRSEQSYYGMVNVARRLYVQRRVQEAYLLLDALAGHMKGDRAYGEAHKMTQMVMSQKKHLQRLEDARLKRQNEEAVEGQENTGTGDEASAAPPEPGECQ